jgi:AcrR family transcriptional regulator
MLPGVSTDAHPTPATDVRRRRVPAMAPDDRRAALIAATVPLLREHGLAISTRQIAQAAGVAEGTIFGVFPDKTSLIQAAMVQCLDPAPMQEALRGYASVVDLRARLTLVADLLGRRFNENAKLIAAARGMAMAADVPPELASRLAESRGRMLSAIAALIEPDSELLRSSPDSVALLLVMMVGATAHGVFGEVDAMGAAEIVTFLLDGLLVRGRPHRRRERPRQTGVP